MTKIELFANDQLLSIVSKPKISSGDRNTVMIHVDFDSIWDRFGKTAVFYTSNDVTVYEMILTDGECTVPHEVLEKAGTLFIGVRGVNSDDDAVKTTTLVKYKIDQGAPAGDGTTVDPTPDVYQQILTKLNKLGQGGQGGEGGNISAIPLPETAEVGQFIVVSAVDENGVVTATEAATIEILEDAAGVAF